MLKPPFELIDCSWPRPVEQKGGIWISQPEWDAPLMQMVPRPCWEYVLGQAAYLIDWRELFRTGIKTAATVHSGEMKNFHVVFRLRCADDGVFRFWDDDGCIIRRDGQVIHEDRQSHPLASHELRVRRGDVLEVAQWQLMGGWLWGARLGDWPDPARDAERILSPYLGRVEERLRSPEGPAVKLYTHGGCPARTVLGLYSLILNGYAPERVLLFGESQWSPRSWALFKGLLPFAEIVPDSRLLDVLQEKGGPQVRAAGAKCWFALKAYIALLHPPTEFCLMDDDVFVLDRLDEALAAFRDHELVYAPDADYDAVYTRAWGRALGFDGHLKTGRFNAGLYWMRNSADPGRLSAQSLKVRAERSEPFIWEQGFIASLFRNARTRELSSARYLFPIFDGLPAGSLGYDYGTNPCGFASVHFGGLHQKPDDAAALMLAADVLNPSRRGAARPSPRAAPASSLDTRPAPMVAA